MELTKELYTVKEVAAITNVQPNTVYRWIKAGKIQALKTNTGTVRITAAAIVDFLS